ncbi:hypothetical protein [Collimonas humicola]|uniref:hypothetical protein n=1 Tax=Collimonas humicola TaxID=2825886 RepID=UPI001B8B943B|nr:hypothetical protein [Collimonas humicola]
MAERVNVLYSGFEISVLPVLEYGPPPPNPNYSYTAFICRPGDVDSKGAGMKILYSQVLPVYSNEAAAVAAGLQQGKLIVDGADPHHSIKGL